MFYLCTATSNVFLLRRFRESEMGGFIRVDDLSSTIADIFDLFQF